MPRFFKESFESAPFLDGDDANHIIKSLRMKRGETLTVCDTKGFDYICIITDTKNSIVALEIKEKKQTVTEPSVFVTLYQCLPKGDKLDTVVKQAVEMGVSRIVPVISINCVSRPDFNQLQKKCHRWQKIADEAAGQSGRGFLPRVCECITLKDASKNMSQDDLALFFYEAGGQKLLIPNNIKTISLIIGPEGGFTEKEAELLVADGAVATTLGPRILRTETAPISALAGIMLLSNNM